MKIESLIQRKDGTRVDMDAPKRQYHFKPTEQDARHIADVDVDHHAKALLRIKEGYRAVDAEDDTFGNDEPNERQLNGSTIHNASYTIKGGDVIGLSDLIDMAFDDSGLTEEEWNALDDADRYVYIDTTLKELVDGEHGDDEGKQVPAQEPAAEPGNPDSEPAADDAATDTDGDHDTAKAAEPVDAAANPVTPETKDQDGNGIDDDIENLKGEALIAAYEARFGRKPSSAMRVGDIRRALSEDDD